MDRTRQYTVTWSPRAVRQLVSILKDARHGRDNPRWVRVKAKECQEECERRLANFPDLRERYSVNGQLCNGMTLRAVPVQIMFRGVEDGQEISIFLCRWAMQDISGPRNP